MNCHLDVSFALSDHEAFRTWCQERYGKLDRLNQTWGTAFWSQTYTAWDEIWLPRPTVTYHNPTLLLDFCRFTSDMTVRFGAMQRQIIKRIAPHQFVTHNAFQTMTSVDLQKFVQEAVDLSRMILIRNSKYATSRCRPAFGIVLSPSSCLECVESRPSSWSWNSSRAPAAKSAAS